jgi:hypothetical protein
MKYSGVSVITRSQPKGVKLLKPKTYFMYHQLEHAEILCSAHHAFMCFAWISEQTAVSSLYNINITVLKPRQIIYCAVRTGSLNQIDTVSSLGR